MNRELKQIWVRIEKWFDAHAPFLAKRFGRPATVHEIVRTERHLGVELPEDLRQSYLRHNGHESLMEGKAWLSLQGIRNNWSSWNSISDEWHSGLIPLTNYDYDVCFCVNLRPRSGEAHGEIDSIYRGNSEGVFKDDFRSWLGSFAYEIEEFEYYPDPRARILDPMGGFFVTLKRGSKELPQEWWQFVLELAVIFGWKPTGVEGSSSPDGSMPDLREYTQREGEIVTKPDAVALGEAIEKLVARFPKRGLKKFGSSVQAINYFNRHGTAGLAKLAKFCKRGSFSIDIY